VTFRGWPSEALEFYEGLTADNSKSYWTAHLPVYENQVRAPMEELLAELSPEFGAGKIFRPYRDVRFSKDKSPYKTNIAATLDRGGYISLSSEGLGAGSGFYMLMPDQLARFRAAIDDDKTGKQIARMVEKARADGIEASAHDILKTAPKGYPKDHPRIELLRQKGLIYWQQWPVGGWLGTPKAKEKVVGLLRAAKPLMKWLETNVGPSEMPDRGR
jgi:uncharacterized protein (TIGR02453 family)